MIDYQDDFIVDVFEEGDWVFVQGREGNSVGRINKIHRLIEMDVCEIRVILGPLAVSTVHLKPSALIACTLAQAMAFHAKQGPMQLIALSAELTEAEMAEVLAWMEQGE